MKKSSTYQTKVLTPAAVQQARVEPAEPEACSNCRFWNPLGDGKQGQCRKNPPTQYDTTRITPPHGTFGMYLLTEPSWWCGSHQLKS